MTGGIVSLIVAGAGFFVGMRLFASIIQPRISKGAR